MRTPVRTGIRGITLIELIIYMGLLTTMLTVLYQLFAIAGYQKLGEIIEHELYRTGEQTLFEIQNELEQATSVGEPALGATSDTLRIDGGAVVISLVDGAIIKTKGGVTAPLTGRFVVVDNLSFSQLGPSTESPTITILFDLTAARAVEGRVRDETFQSSVSLR